MRARGGREVYTLMCFNIGKSKTINFHLSLMENKWFLGVPIFKHVRVILAQNQIFTTLKEITSQTD